MLADLLVCLLVDVKVRNVLLELRLFVGVCVIDEDVDML